MGTAPWYETRREKSSIPRAACSQVRASNRFNAPEPQAALFGPWDPLAVPNVAKAQELTSVYTPLDLKKCKDVTPAEAKEHSTIWRCEGYEGISVRVAEGDLRIFVSFGPKAET